MKRYIYSPPKLFRTVLPEAVWHTANNKVLLTFDDAPSPATEIILKLLAENDIKAVFFCTGKQMVEYESAVNEILSEGHTIGNHTYSHTKITKLSDDELKEEIERVEELTDTNMRYFRPPYGRYDRASAKVIEEEGYTNVMWSLFTFDYKNDFNIVKLALRNYLQSNSIVVFHDKYKNRDIIADSIKFCISSVNEKGFFIGDPSECLK